jgi:GT2 family glycosyltransferase
MINPDVTIVVVPRDHFSDSIESLDSIYANSDTPFSLVYVDGGSPQRVARYLKEKAAQSGFRLIRKDHYLSPNHARNIGTDGVNTQYIVFIDNDVVVAPGWLSSLLNCANRTGAAVIAPLTFERRPLHTIVHFAGGESGISRREVDGCIQGHITEKICKEPPPESIQTQLAEFHCFLIRTDVLRAIGGFDEQMLSLKDHLEFCITAREAGYRIQFEPASRVTFLPPETERLRLFDVPFYALRWSDEWALSSLRRLLKKWDLAEDEYFARQYRNLGWRRRSVMMEKGVLHFLPSCKLKLAAERLLRPLERRLNRLVSRRYSERHMRSEST